MQTDRLNDGVSAVCGATRLKVAWDAVKTLNRGLEFKIARLRYALNFLTGLQPSQPKTIYGDFCLAF